MDERLTHLVDDVTSGLTDDLELRLDVRAELSTHLERTAQSFQEEGQSEEESIAQAMKVFGSPLDLAGELLDANKRRMKLRALARLAIRALLIPAAFVIALWVGYVNYSQQAEAITVLRLVDGLSGNGFGGVERHEPGLVVVRAIVGALYAFHRPVDDEWFAKYNTTDIPMAKPSLGMPAIANAHADNTAYWGYFASSQIDNENLNAIAGHGMRIDPGNALYHYELAVSYLQRAIEEKRLPSTGAGTYTYIVRDAALFEKGLRELARGMEKPYLRTYRLEIMQERFARLPAPKYYRDYSGRLVLTASELYPELARYRQVAREVPAIAEYLLAHGHREDARIPLLFSQRISEQLASDPDSLIHLLVAQDIAEMGAGQSASIADRIGQHDWAQQLRNWHERFVKAGIPSLGKDGARPTRPTPEIQRLQESGGVLVYILSSVFLRAGISISPDDLAPTRALDYWFIERLSVSILLLLLLVALIGTALLWGFWTLAAGKSRKSFILLLPTRKMLVRVFVYGLLLPLGIYFIYTCIPAISGREYNIVVNSDRILIEHLLLLGTVLLLPGILAGRYLKKRCVSLGIAIQPGHTLWRIIGPVVLLSSALGGAVMIADKLLGQMQMMVDANYLLILSFTLIWVLIIVAIWLMILLVQRMMRNNKTDAIYYGTLARSLVPVYAIAIVLLTGITQPYLAHREAQLLAEDKLVFLHGNEVGISPMENMAVEKIKARLFPAKPRGLSSIPLNFDH